MKTMNKATIGFYLVLTAFALQASTASANGFYLGAKTGNLNINVSEFEDDTAQGLVAGYEFASGVAVQAETLSGSADIDTFYGSYDGDFESTALYAVFRSMGETVYGFAKLGVLREEVKVDMFYYDVSETDTGASVGLGGGLRLGQHLLLEAEYTVIEQDVDFFGINAAIQF